jgi:hypothetical protein
MTLRATAKAVASYSLLEQAWRSAAPKRLAALRRAPARP